MNVEGFARALVDQGGHDKIDPLVQSFSDRILMRIYASPSLLAYLINCGISTDKGSHKIEFDFKKLPDEVVPQVKTLIASNNVKVVSYTDDYGDHTGFVVTISAQELEQARKSSKKKPDGQQSF